jgi:hypothetical protein
MVEMSMGKKYAIQSFRWNRKWFPVSLSEFSLLVKPAVYQKFNIAGLNEIA